MSSEIIIYQTEDGKTKLEVVLENETVWLTQKLMAELFQTSVPNINIHLKNIFDEGELEEKAFKNFGMISLNSQETILQDLHAKVVDVYNFVVGDTYLLHLLLCI